MFTCKHCAKQCKTKAGLASHERSCKKTTIEFQEPEPSVLIENEEEYQEALTILPELDEEKSEKLQKLITDYEQRTPKEKPLLLDAILSEAWHDIKDGDERAILLSYKGKQYSLETLVEIKDRLNLGESKAVINSYILKHVQEDA